MNIDLLFALQQLEAKEGEIQRNLKKIPQYQELREMKEAFDGHQKNLREKKDFLEINAQTIKDLEGQMADSEAEQKKINEDLYDGSVSSPRELEIIQEQLATILEQYEQVQNELLALAGDKEIVEAESKAIDHGMQSLYQQFNQLKGQYTRIKINLEQELAAIRIDKKKILAKVDPAGLAWFEGRKAKFAGLPIGEIVENQSCNGCHTLVPNVLVKEARQNPGEIYCERCGRLLYVPPAGNK